MERDLGRNDAPWLDRPFAHPLGRDRGRDAGAADAPADVPLLVGPCDGLVPQAHRIPFLLAHEDAALDVYIEFGSLRLRQRVDYRCGGVVGADLRPLDDDLLAAREA